MGKGNPCVIKFVQFIFFVDCFALKFMNFDC